MGWVARGPPEPDESAEGYLLRLCEANGRGWRNAVREAGSPRDLADVNGMRRLSAGLSTGPRPRVCRACLREREVRLSAWQVKACPACPLHGCLLADSCAGCGSPLAWAHDRLARCGRCLLPLAEGETPVASPAAVRLSAALALAAVAGRADPPSWSPQAYIRAATFFGVDPMSPDWRSRCMTCHDVTEAAGRAERAGSVLLDWPEGFPRWLSARRDGRAGGLNAFGPWPSRLRAAFADQVAAPVLSEARRFFGCEWDGVPIKRWSLFAPSNRMSSMLSAREAGKRMRVSPSAVRKLVEAGEVTGRLVPCGTRVFAAVRAGDAVAVQSILPQSWTRAETARRLGISGPQVRNICNLGYLLTGLDGWGVAPLSVHDLLLRLRGRAQSVPVVNPVSLADAARSRSLPFAALLERVLSGRLACSTTDGGGLCGVVVSRTDAFGFGRGASGATCSVGRAAAMLSVSTRMIPVLVEAKCLDCDGDCDARLGRRTVTVASVARFPDRYVTASVLAKELRSNTRTVLARLTTAGVAPLVTSDSEAGISSVWPIREAWAVLGLSGVAVLRRGNRLRRQELLHVGTAHDKEIRGVGAASSEDDPLDAVPTHEVPAILSGGSVLRVGT